MLVDIGGASSIVYMLRLSHTEFLQRLVARVCVLGVVSVSQCLDDDCGILSLLVRLEAHDLAYEAAGLWYGAFTLGTTHVVDFGGVVVVWSVGVERRSGLLAASAASGLAIW